MINLCICQCDTGISRSAGTTAALSYIVNQDDAWVFEDRRYMPNRLVYRTLLDVYYRDHEHPPYHQLEGYGYTYLGSMVESLNKFDLYLYKCAADTPCWQPGMTQTGVYHPWRPGQPPSGAPRGPAPG